MARPRVRTQELRSHVLAVAIEQFELCGPDGLRVRELAKEAGTSATALYELFGAKADLVRAVFFAGFTLLDERLDAVERTADPRCDTIRSLSAVRSFAQTHPALFGLMFAQPIAEFSPTEDDWTAARRIHRRAEEGIVRFLESVDANADPIDVALALVALNRGLITAELSGTLGTTAEVRDRRWNSAINAQLDGYRESTFS